MREKAASHIHSAVCGTRSSQLRFELDRSLVFSVTGSCHSLSPLVEHRAQDSSPDCDKHPAGRSCFQRTSRAASSFSLSCHRNRMPYGRTRVLSQSAFSRGGSRSPAPAQAGFALRDSVCLGLSLADSSHRDGSCSGRFAYVRKAATLFILVRRRFSQKEKSPVIGASLNQHQSEAATALTALGLRRGERTSHPNFS